MAKEVVVPEYIQTVISQSATSDGPIRAIVQSDLGPKGGFLVTWACVDNQWLYVITQTGYSDENKQKNVVEEIRKRSLFARDLDRQSYLTGDELDLRNGPLEVQILSKYPLAKISELKCQTFTGSVVLLATVDEQDKVICRGSSSKIGDLNDFAKKVNNILKGEEQAEGKSERFGGPPRRRSNETCPTCGRLYPDPGRQVCPHCLDRRTLFKRVLALTPKYRVQLTMMIVVMILTALVRLATPFLSGRVFFDEVLNPNGKYAGMIWQFVLLALTAEIVSVLLDIIHGRINATVAAKIVFDLKSMVFEAMQKLSLSFYSKRQTGALMNRVNNDADELQYFFNDVIPPIVVNGISLIGVAAILFSFNWRLTLYVLLPVPIIIYFIKVIYPKLWKIYSKRFRANSRLNSVINDSLTGVRVVKAFGQEDYEVARFAARNASVFKVAIEQGKMSHTVFPLMSYIMGLGSIIVWGVGGWNVVKGQMSFGTLISFIGYLGMLYGPLHFMTWIVDRWSSTMNSAHRIFEIIDSNDFLPIPAEPVSMPKIQGEVIARDVEFAYDEGKPILKDINFHVKPGEMIGLVGRSGAGKTTMINLIARLYDVQSGSITIDGVDVRDINREDFNKQVGMVLQETFLFRGSILDNIRYAKPDATPEEVIRAAKIANAHDFITMLPDGYETVIGRRGHDLSGGERQRLAIARAVLLNPKILILDEATANIDTETEKLIQEAIEQLVQGRTTFAIAHRLSTLRKADRLFVFDRGTIVEIGSHNELMENPDGVYYKLFTTQRESLELIDVSS